MNKFPLGQIVATPAALDLLSELYKGLAPLHAGKLLDRHAAGDWGEVSLEDRLANDSDLLTGGRLVSSYDLKLGHKIMIITEADRSSTCLLLPSGY